MSMKRLFPIGILLISMTALGLVPVAAQDATEEATERPPVVTQTVTLGDHLLTEPFDQDNAWEAYSSDDGVAFTVAGGAYAMVIPKTVPKVYVWAVNTLNQADESISATFFQIADNPDARYGLMCRTDTTGVGYYFIVGGDGTAFIGKGLADKVAFLTDTVASEAVNLGTDSNTLRADCVGNYLALYVNDQLVVDANDDEFTTGVSGLTALSGPDMDTDITVDDLDIYAATAIAGPASTASASTTSAIAPPAVDNVVVGKALLSETFDSPDAWESFDDNDRKEHLYVSDGAYTISTGGDLYIWGQNLDVIDNDVITVDASLQDGPETSGYGVICRASDDNKGSGYYFLISGDGFYSISRSDPDAATFIKLVDWTESSAINKGTSTNSITVACVDDSLALYVNGTRLAETTDSTYTKGVTGLTAASGQPGVANIQFDNLGIFNAKAG